ncbi:MAG TPA: flagellar transcriptional regulator FlhC [Burkholderiales bacterium]|nr:flagellar transcriptional regulator FlhC [Burkholderiales bacterium]
MAARNKSVVTDADEVQLGAELARAGARLQVLETETSLSRERLLRLYKEVRGVSPPKGMLPFSTDWFMSWMPNIHASIFINIHSYLLANTQTRGIRAVLAAFKLYVEHTKTHELEQVLSFTRAWSLVRFFDAKLLDVAPCKTCGGKYVMHAMDLRKDYVCGLCNVPSRAGKTRKRAIPEKVTEIAAARRAPTGAPGEFLLQAIMGSSAARPRIAA